MRYFSAISNNVYRLFLLDLCLKKQSIFSYALAFSEVKIYFEIVSVSYLAGSCG